MENYRDYENLDAPFEVLKGKTISAIRGLEKGSERIEIDCADETKFMLTYYHDCCASCSIEEIVGDPSDLLNSEILLAEEVSTNEPEPIEKERREIERTEHKAKHGWDYNPHESETWTFYKLATIKGSVTIRWYGESNGYYSESATFEQVNPQRTE